MSRERLEARRAALRARLDARLAEARARRPAQRRRRWPYALLLLLLALLLCLLPPCRCEPPVVPEPGAPAPPAPAAEPLPAPPEPEPLPGGRVQRTERPDYPVHVPAPLPWLSAFRLQVAARSPRLADCFVGAADPGALKWSGQVDPGAGIVADASVEVLGGTSALTAEQRRCVLGVLAEPPYRLSASGQRGTPSTVSLVLEF
jgi:hypothetical protein